ncbi:hypothetical protein SAY86_026972 [Trapa natans]|uniref:Uncharacterized protein n=1 Tax=Trapa natans TaxID=22666 RepID=A0AAN7KLQ8_TRANT|nr:hypothetical protein SAY86_026972 [Trapa natans]
MFIYESPVPYPRITVIFLELYKPKLETQQERSAHFALAGSSPFLTLRAEYELTKCLLGCPMMLHGLQQSSPSSSSSFSGVWAQQTHLPMCALSRFYPYSTYFPVTGLCCLL